MSIVCDAVSDLIPLYRDKSASAGTRNFVESHLKVCPSCRKYYSEYVKASRRGKKGDGFYLTVDGGADFAALAGRIRRRRNIRVGSMVLLGAAVCAMLCVLKAEHAAGEEAER